MRQRSLLTAATAALILAAGIAVAAPASATDCPAGSACIWGDTNYATGGNTAAFVKWAKYIPNFGSYTYVGTTIDGNNSASSVSNNGNYSTVYLYDNTSSYATDLAFTLAKKTGDGNLADSSGYAPSGHNDDLGSGYFEGWQPA